MTRDEALYKVKGYLTDYLPFDDADEDVRTIARTVEGW